MCDGVVGGGGEVVAGCVRTGMGCSWRVLEICMLFC